MTARRWDGKICMLQATPCDRADDICDCFGRHDNEDGPDHCSNDD